MRYAVTFNVKKFGPVLYKTAICLKKQTAISIGLLTNKISLNSIFFFLLFLGVTFSVPSQCSFRKLQLHAIKKFCYNLLLYLFSICISSKSVSQTFKIVFLPGDIEIFVLCCIVFALTMQRNLTRQNVNGKFWENVELYKVVCIEKDCFSW